MPSDYRRDLQYERNRMSRVNRDAHLSIGDDEHECANCGGDCFCGEPTECWTCSHCLMYDPQDAREL